MGRHRDRMWLFCALVLASGTACATGPAPQPAVQPAQLTQSAPAPVVPPAERSKPLEGRWSVVLLLDPLSMRHLPDAEEAKGEIAFGSGSWWSNADRFGRQHVDLKPFFGRLYAPPDGVDAFSAADTSMFSEASGGIIGDSVSIDFLPRIDHGGVSLWGRFWGDSARGTWRRRGLEGGGTFVMRRVSKEAVAVAAIPVPKTIAPTVVAKADTVKPKPMTKAQRLAAARAARLAKQKARRDSIAAAKAERIAKQKARADSIADAKAQRLAREKATADSIAAARASAQALTRQLSNPMPQPATTVASNAPSAPEAKSTAPAPSVAEVKSTAPTRAPDSSAAPSPATAMRVSDATPAPADPKAPVAIRVRLLDKGSNKYVATKYSLHVPDGRWMFGRLRTGNSGDGFGTATTGHPGRYEVEITDFMCGDKLWFLKDRILQPVEVKPGQPADVTIEADLANAPARPSFDNKSGAKCEAPIGSER